MPQIDPLAYVDPTARVIGNVHIAAGCYVGPFAVIRADEVGVDGNVKPVRIGADSNVQDGVSIHALGGTEVCVGQRCSIAHGAIVHGPCSIADGCFVGFRAVVFDSVLAEGVFVAASAVVQGVELLEGDYVGVARSVLSSADVTLHVQKISDQERAFMEKVLAANRKLVTGYIKSHKEI
jgi:carbonic anhydrase/acetyltransferase-like protein (isoleucine patch superfamily)